MRPVNLDIRDGAVLGLLLWAVEGVALAAGVLGIGGLSVLATLVDDLARLGLGYLVLGGLFGLLRRTPLRRLGPVLGWLVVGWVADAGVVPTWLHLGLVLLAGALWVASARVPETLRGFAAAIGAVWLVGLAVPAPPSTVPRGVRGAGPSVVLIVVDTLRADHVGAHGYPRATTPNLDALAADGLSFAAATAPSSWTLPSHASLFTGLRPADHGAHAGHPSLPDGPETLAERFDRRGYRTVGLSANAWVSGGTGLDRGFEDFRFLGDDGLASQLLLALATRRPRDLGGQAIADVAVEAIEAAHQADEPLFLFANLLEAHEPFGTLPQPERSRFGPVDPLRGRVWLQDMPRFWCSCSEPTEASPPDGLVCRDGLYRASDDRVRATVDAYDAGVAYADARIGEIVDAVKRSGRWEETWVLVTSDHGEHLGEDGRLGHMVWLDEVLLDIPLVVHGPGVPAGSVDPDPFDLSDLGPWLDDRLDGGPGVRRPRAVSEVHPHPEGTTRGWGAVYGCDFTPARTPRRSVRVADRRVWRQGDAVTTSEAAGGVRPATPEERAWTAGPFAGEGAPVDAGTRRALEALGYVE
jgi:arylsulfatase A-like enzyme